MIRLQAKQDLSYRQWTVTDKVVLWVTEPALAVTTMGSASVDVASDLLSPQAITPISPSASAKNATNLNIRADRRLR